jgi:glycerol-3-phosphate dehydrogenase
MGLPVNLEQVPNTTDGRVLFLLPWEGSTIAGTTDSQTEIADLPKAKEEEIQFILEEVSLPTMCRRHLESDAVI